MMTPPGDQQPTRPQLAGAARTFDLLSTPNRLHLVWALSTGEHDVTTLAELIGTSVPAASQHLARLRAAGVVSAVREGRRQLYRVDDPHILTVVNQVFSHIAPDGTLAPDPVFDERATGPAQA
jgi:DNA-binding transcriptional ArsR family regulator